MLNSSFRLSGAFSFSDDEDGQQDAIIDWEGLSNLLEPVDNERLGLLDSRGGFPLNAGASPPHLHQQEAPDFLPLATSCLDESVIGDSVSPGDGLLDATVGPAPPVPSRPVRGLETFTTPPPVPEKRVPDDRDTSQTSVPDDNASTGTTTSSAVPVQGGRSTRKRSLLPCPVPSPAPPLREDAAMVTFGSPWQKPVISPDAVVEHAVNAGKMVAADLREVKQELDRLFAVAPSETGDDDDEGGDRAASRVAAEICRLLVEVAEIAMQLNTLIEYSFLGGGTVLTLARRMVSEYLCFQLQLNVWNDDLRLTSDDEGRPLAISVAAQPMPCTVMQRRPLTVPVIVRVFRGANPRYASTPVTVTVSVHPCASTGTGGSSQRSRTSSSDPRVAAPQFHTGVVRSVQVNNRGVAVFDGLSLREGTRKQPVEFHFTAAFDDDEEGNVSQMCVSRPLIVISRDEQFVDVEGILLRRSLFQSRERTAPWPKFCNELSLVFLQCTKQDDDADNGDQPLSIRPLSPDDFRSFEERFFPTVSRNSLRSSDAAASNCGSVITLAEFDSFWTWFSAALGKIRRTKHYRALFKTGLMFGFLDRDQAERVLAGSSWGTFLLRFGGPKASPGSVVISRTLESGCYEHGKVEDYVESDVKMNPGLASSPLLPDFLLRYPGPQHALHQIMRAEHDPATGEVRRWKAEPKKTALQPYASVVSSNPSTNDEDTDAARYKQALL